MKRIALNLLCWIAVVMFAATSLAMATNTPAAGEHFSRAGTDEKMIGEIDHAMTTNSPAVSPDTIVSTRSSFTSRWNPMSQATSYLLDVSTSPSFDSYATGYHSLEVGSTTWRVITGLSPGTTYYYRVTGSAGIASGASSEM